MQEKARMKKLKLDFYTNFAGQSDLTITINLHRMMRDVLLKNSSSIIELHKHTIMHKFLGDFDQFSHILPLHVIGDPIRLQ
jgi:hypothetical protein